MAAPYVPSTPRVFISHSWSDKPLARRVARRLEVRGIDVWIDEERLRLGDQLSRRILGEIEASACVVVISTAAAVASKWVALECEAALKREPSIPVLPLIVEPNARAAFLEDILSVDLPLHVGFEPVIDEVARAVLDLGAPRAVQADIYQRQLEQLAKEVPALAPTIRSISADGTVHSAVIAAIPRDPALAHEFETAMAALYELCAEPGAKRMIVTIAQEFYRAIGTGYDLIARHLDNYGTDDDGGLLSHLVGRYEEPTRLGPALDLFARDLKREGYSPILTLYSENSSLLSARDIDRFIAVAVAPPPEGVTTGWDRLSLAFELYARCPDSAALQLLWFHWVASLQLGAEKGQESWFVFFRKMERARLGGLRHFARAMTDLRRAVRGLAGGTPPDFSRAVEILASAHAAGYALWSDIRDELSDASSREEWSRRPWLEEVRDLLFLYTAYLNRVKPGDFDPDADAAYDKLASVLAGLQSSR